MRILGRFFHISTLLIFLSALVVYALTYAVRYATYSHWMENPREFVVEEIPPMTSMDAYYWLKMARELDEGTLGKGQAEPTKGYPDRVPLAIKDTPGLLAELISCAKTFTGGNYYRAGLLLIPLLSGLFVVPLYFYCTRIGFGASATLGGLVGSFSHAYYIRTMMGRVDTDLLNLFFALSTACFILPINRQRQLWSNLSLAAGAGLTMYLFMRWYQQPGIILVYLVTMVFYLLIMRVSFAHIALILPAFLLTCGPEYVLQVFESLRTFIQAYLAPPLAGNIIWPNILDVVSETRAYGLILTLKSLHGFLPLVVAGLIGLAYLCIRHVKQMVPLSPVIAVGLWSLGGPNRFAMYLAPLIGVGCGVLIELVINYLASKEFLRSRFVVPVSIASMALLFFSTIHYTRFFYQPQIVVPPAIVKALLDVKRIVPKHSAMFTQHWGYGYALMEIGDFATYHDGSLHGGLRTTLISKAMTSSRQRDMVALLAYLEDHGFRQLSTQIHAQKLSGQQLLDRVFSYPESFHGQSVYVLYTEDMIQPLGTLSLFGTWDFDRRTSEPMGYIELSCSSMNETVITCQNSVIDLARGVMRDDLGEVLFREVLFVNNGLVVEQKHYTHDSTYYLQVLAKDNQIQRLLVADERLFRSNFNQQYLLGNYDPQYFDEVYNNFPTARLLKVKNTSKANSPGQ